MTQLRVFCPINKITIWANSDRLDDLGQFSKFILWAINQKYTITEISETVSLGDIIIHEEISYLLSIGFILETADGFVLSETGKGYLSLLSSIEIFNAQQQTAQINRFSGLISKSNANATAYIDENSICLPTKINRYIVQNRDYKPLQEFALVNYSSIFSHLRPEFLESIYFSLSLSQQDEQLYQEYILPSIPSFTEEYPINDETMIVLKRCVQCLYFHYNDNRLIEHRNVLSTLDLLYKYDSSLLSERSLQLLEIAKEEKITNLNAVPIYYDASTGLELSDPPYLKPVEDSKLIHIHLPTISYKNLDSQVIINDIEYQRTFTQAETEYILQKVPFSIFKEVK